MYHPTSDSDSIGEAIMKRFPITGGMRAINTNVMVLLIVFFDLSEIKAQMSSATTNKLKTMDIKYLIKLRSVNNCKPLY